MRHILKKGYSEKPVKLITCRNLKITLTRTEQFVKNISDHLCYRGFSTVSCCLSRIYKEIFICIRAKRKRIRKCSWPENYFEKDSFNLAINGDGNYAFLDIIDDYSRPKQVNLQGITPEYPTCITVSMKIFRVLNGFKTKDMLLAPITEGAKGDAMLELGDTTGALRYRKAFSMNDNEFTTPIYMMKAANLLESMDQLDEALVLYRQIKEKYPESNEGQNADQYIGRIEIKKG